jgi:hypothetical protein
MNHKRATLLVIAGLTFFALFGCGSSTVDPPATSARIIDLIIAGNSNPQRIVQISARTVLIRACMKAQGFRSPAVFDLEGAPDRDPVLETGEFSSVPPETAALDRATRTGFMRPTSNKSQHQPIDREVPPPSDRRYWRDLLGPRRQNGTFVVNGIARHTYTTSGCIAEATRRLYGSPARAIRAEYLPEDLNLVVEQKVRDDPRYRAASARWSVCMQSVWPDPPTEPYEFPSVVLASQRARVRSENQMLAAADVRCQYRSGYIRTAVMLKRRYAVVVSRPYRQALTAVLATLHHAIQRARSIVSRRR